MSKRYIGPRYIFGFMWWDFTKLRLWFKYPNMMLLSTNKATKLNDFWPCFNCFVLDVIIQYKCRCLFCEFLNGFFPWNMHWCIGWTTWSPMHIKSWFGPRPIIINICHVSSIYFLNPLNEMQSCWILILFLNTEAASSMSNKGSIVRISIMIHTINNLRVILNSCSIVLKTRS